MDKKKLQEFKYDLEHETDIEKLNELITNYMYYHIPAERFVAHELKELKKLNEKRISALQDVLDVQCSDGNWNNDAYMHGMANGMILIHSMMTDTRAEFLNQPEDGYIEDKCCPEDDDECSNCPEEKEETLNKLCEGKKIKPQYPGLLKKWLKINEEKIAILKEEPEDYNERNREALNGLYGKGSYGYNYEGGKEFDADFKKNIMMKLGIPKELMGTGRDSGAILSKVSFAVDDNKNAHDRNYTITVKNYPQEELQKLAKDTIKKIKSPGVPLRENMICGIPSISIADARKVLRDAFADDPDFKQSYMANIRMFINDHADVLIGEPIINDLIDFILREEG